MHPALQQQLEVIERQLEADDTSPEDVEKAFSAFQQSVREVMQDDTLSDEQKGQHLSNAQSALTDLQQRATEQHSLVQDGLKKLTKGRRSLKSYQQNQAG